jgi:hypothetical protein
MQQVNLDVYLFIIFFRLLMHWKILINVLNKCKILWKKKIGKIL